MTFVLLEVSARRKAASLEGAIGMVVGGAVV